jgi:hypothetical protein
MVFDFGVNSSAAARATSHFLPAVSSVRTACLCTHGTPGAFTFHVMDKCALRALLQTNFKRSGSCMTGYLKHGRFVHRVQ